jgi:peptide deformylase
MIIRRRKRLKLARGTYVVELWLSEGRIRINPVNIPHISIEKITSQEGCVHPGKENRGRLRA